MMEYLVKMNRHLRITMFFVLIFVSFFLMIDTGNLIFALFFFVFLGLLIASNVSHARQMSEVLGKSLDKALIKNNFKADSQYISDDYLSGIALNKEDGNVAVFKRKTVEEDFYPSIFEFENILECSIKEDDQTIIKTSNSSIIGRSIAGGVLFGGIGAAIGGITSEKVSTQKIRKATLFIVVNDIDCPVYEINFLNSNLLMDRNNPRYQRIYSDLNKWHKTLSVIIKRNELNSKTV